MLNIGRDIFDAASVLDTSLFEVGRHRKADGVLGAVWVSHHEIGSHWIQAAFYAFHSGIEGFLIDA